jgi:hypothetical protein
MGQKSVDHLVRPVEVKEWSHNVAVIERLDKKEKGKQPSICKISFLHIYFAVN